MRNGSAAAGDEGRGAKINTAASHAPKNAAVPARTLRRAPGGRPLRPAARDRMAQIAAAIATLVAIRITVM